MDTCRRPGCSAKIVWLKHETTGKVSPIDAEPTWGGNIELVPDPETGEIVAYRMVKKSERQGGPIYYLNHFATCKNPPARPKNKAKAQR